jgi:hypothetical protein
MKFFGATSGPLGIESDADNQAPLGANGLCHDTARIELLSASLAILCVRLSAVAWSYEEDIKHGILRRLAETANMAVLGTLGTLKNPFT